MNRARKDYCLVGVNVGYEYLRGILIFQIHQDKSRNFALRGHSL